MTLEIVLTVVAVVWWSVTVVIFSALCADADTALRDRITAAVLWPFFVAFSLPVMLWRIPFKTVRQMKADIRNRGEWDDFQQWRKERNKNDQSNIDQTKGGE